MKKYCFEIGTGVLFDYIPKQAEYDYPKQAIKIIGNIGFRFVSAEGFIFKLDYVPYYSFDRAVTSQFGLSIGHYFKNCLTLN